MRILLDTHALLWWHDGTLPSAVVRRVQTAEDVQVSAASAWEIAIKSALGKLRLEDRLADIVALYGFVELPVRFEHAALVALLPPHHADPFDRMLVAQATVEGLTLVTKDAAIRRYAVATSWDG